MNFSFNIPGSCPSLIGKIHFLFSRILSKSAFTLCAAVVFGMLPASAALAAALVNHAAGTPATGSSYWSTAIASGGGGCGGCHLAATPSDAAFSAATATAMFSKCNNNNATTGNPACPNKPLSFYANGPVAMTTEMAVVGTAGTGDMSAVNEANATANQNDLSAYFASLFTPVITHNQATTVSSGAAFSGSILPVAGSDFLVTSTTYGITPAGSGMAVASTTGAISGTAPVVTTPTTYSITLSATNSGAIYPTATPTGTVVLSLKVMGRQIITFGAAPTMTFGGGTATVSATGGGSGNTVTFSVPTTTSVCSVSGSTVTAKTAGTCTVQADQAGTANSYDAAAPVTQNITINQAAQTITFGTAPTMTFGGATATVSATGGGSGNAVTFSVPTTTTICSVAGNTVTAKAAGTCTVQADQAGSGNYLAGTNTQNITINQAGQTITFGTAPTMTFGGATATVSATGGGSGNAVTFSVPVTTAICSVAGNTVTAKAAGTCTVQADQAGNGNYLAGTNTQNITINQAGQTVSFTSAPASLQVGGTGTVSATGGGSGNAVTFSVPATTTVCSVTGNTVTALAAGTCTVQADQAGNSNYSAGLASQNIAVNLIPQTITFGTAPSMTYGGPTATVSATGGASNNAVTFSVPVTTTICSVAGSIVTALAAGTCTVQASQAGNATYAAATQTQSITIAKASQSLSFATVPSVVVGGSGTISATGGASGNAVTFTSQSTGICTATGTNGATITGVAVGTCTIAADQATSSNYSAAPQITQTITVGQGSQVITFGSAPAVSVGGTGTVTLSSGASGNAVSYTSLTTSACTVNPGSGVVTGITAGTNNCTIAANQAGNANYTAAAQATLNFSIGKANQTISFGTAPALVAGATAMVSATATSTLAVSFASTTPTICSVTGSTVSGIAVGTCTIAATQTGNTNYNAAAQVTQNISVGQGTQAITFGAAPAVAVGGTGIVTVSSSSGLAVTLISSTTSICTIAGTTVTGVKAGTCTILANQAGNANYTAANQASLNITVSNLPPTVTAASMSAQLNTASTFDLAPFITGYGVTGVQVSTQPAHGAVSVSGTKVTYTPNKDFFGTDTFEYKAYGDAGLVSTSSAKVTVTIATRPDPLKDANVTGLINAETAAIKRFGMAQVFNFQQRLESRHHAVYGASSANSPAMTGGAPAPAGGASPAEQGRGYFNSWQPGTVLSYENDPNILLHSAQLSGNRQAIASDQMYGVLMNAMAGVLTNYTLNLGTVSNVANGAMQSDEFGRVEVWAAGNLRFGTRSQSGLDSKFTTDGISVGADKRMDRKLTLGMGMGYARDKSSIGSDGTNSSANGSSVAGYASYQMDSGNFLDFLLGYGKVTFNTNRYVSAVNDFASATRKGDQLFGSLSFGYEYRKDGLLWSPYGRYDYSFDRLDVGTETGAGTNALSYSSQKLRSSHLAFGMRGQSVHQTDFGVVQPHIRFEYQHGTDASGATSVAYADLLEVQYAVAATSQNSNAVLVGLGSDFLVSDTLRFGLDYQRLRSSGFENYQSINLRLTKTIKGKNDFASLLEEGYGASIARPSGLRVAAGFAFDDNVSRASAKTDKVSDKIYSLNVNQALPFLPTKYTRLTLSGFLDVEKYRTYTGLGHFSAGGQGEYAYRFSGDFGSPTVGIFARYTADAYESDLRDGSRRSVGVNLRKALTDRINFFMAASNNVRKGRSDVFNTRDNSGRMNLDYALATGHTLYLTGEYRKGDIVSSGQPSLQTLDISTVFVRDDVFANPAFYDYRTKGKTGLTTLGYNLSLGTKDSLDFAWRHVKSTPDMVPAYAEQLQYIDNQYSFSYLMAF